MERQWLLWAVVLAVGVMAAALFAGRAPAGAGTPVVINDTPVPPVPTLDAARVAQGESVYAQHCAACHGANLEGAPDWKKSLADGSLPPPPHDSSGHTWHHTDTLLLSLIADGGDPAYNSKMPAFKDKLTPEEMAAVLEFIKGKWGRTSASFSGGLRSRGVEEGLRCLSRNQLATFRPSGMIG